jgi:hypothetical protein
VYRERVQEARAKTVADAREMPFIGCASPFASKGAGYVAKAARVSGIVNAINAGPTSKQRIEALRADLAQTDVRATALNAGVVTVLEAGSMVVDADFYNSLPRAQNWWTPAPSLTLVVASHIVVVYIGIKLEAPSAEVSEDGRPSRLHTELYTRIDYSMVGAPPMRIPISWATNPTIDATRCEVRSGGISIWTGRRLSTLRLSPFRPRLFGDGFRFHRRHRQQPSCKLAPLLSVLSGSTPAQGDAELHGCPAVEVEADLAISQSSRVRSCPWECVRPLQRGAWTHDVRNL